MKKLLLLFMAVLLMLISPAFPQSLMDYISAVKGDTLVIKDYYEMNKEPNSLYYVLLLDTVNVPSGRVYELKTNGYYPHWRTPRTSSKHPTVIVGADPTPIVNNKNAQSSPPLICNIPMTIDPGPIGIEVMGDLTIKNCALVPADASGNVNWLFASIDAPDLNLIFNNCLMERTQWVFVSARYENCNITFRNCYFVNMSGYPCRRNGGVFDCFASQDTLLVENCTHVMAQGNLYTLKNNLFKSIIVNHNTFINCAGSVFANPGYQAHFILANNIFINSNIQPFNPSYNDSGITTDPDFLPMGLVNINPYLVNGTIDTHKKYYLDDNLVYWDPSLAGIDSVVNADRINGADNWQSQMIRMNARAQGMFNDNSKYPYLLEGSWQMMTIPHFIEPKDLFTTQLENIKSFAIKSAADSEKVILPLWRLTSSGLESYEYPDWPVPVDLSYSDADLKVGARGFPLGDLNWFPDKKNEWLTIRTEEYERIQYYIDGVTENNSPLKFQLEQNYPNPFNPSTCISFSIYKAGFVTLKVYNLLGQEVATLLDGFRNPKIYNIKFDGTGLAGGVYFYRLTANGENKVRKMLLVK